ncbi:MAG: SIMPL domain-containing protein [Erysipelothrix sp.]|nr:SIMPL domain-containing protein [Erysipelothrix sp.]
MNRTITVKGTGNVSVKPDLIIITMNIESKKMEYDQTMQLAAKSLNTITSVIESLGFDKEDLKTTTFSVNTHYTSYRDKDDNYKSKFDGYICEQGLKLEFDFDSKVMSDVFTAIAQTSVDPRMNIQFSVKDQNAVNEKLLVEATENAKKKAEILSKASGVDLGKLISVDYNWGELHLYSPTRYEMKDRSMLMQASEAISIVPDDISASDTVTFVWEIN